MSNAPDAASLEALIREKMQGLPSGFTLEQMTAAMKTQQNATQAEKTVDDFLKSLKDELMRDKMTQYNDDILEGFLLDEIAVNSLKRFCDNEGDLDEYVNFIHKQKDKLISLNGRGLEIFENTAAGRSSADLGLLRGLMNAIMHKTFDKNEKKGV